MDTTEPVTNYLVSYQYPQRGNWWKPIALFSTQELAMEYVEHLTTPRGQWQPAQGGELMGWHLEGQNVFGDSINFNVLPLAVDDQVQGKS